MKNRHIGSIHVPTIIKKIMCYVLTLMVVVSSAGFNSIKIQAAEPEIITYMYKGESDHDDLWNIQGDARFSGSKIKLTDGKNSVGSAFLKLPIKGDKDKGFSTFFKFELPNKDSKGIGADGLFFVLAKSSNQYGSSGGGMGFEGIPNSIGFEFDTYANSNKLFDIEHYDTHISIYTNGTDPVDGDAVGKSYFNRTYSGDAFAANGPFYVWIEYDPSTNYYEIRTSTSSSRPSKVSANGFLDINKDEFLGEEQFYIGFTSATGGYYEDHNILKWYFADEFIEGGLSEYGNYVADPYPPSTPLTRETDTGLELYGSTDNGTGVEFYEYSTNNGLSWTKGTKVTLIIGNSYSVKVRAIDGVSNMSIIGTVSGTFNPGPDNGAPTAPNIEVSRSRVSVGGSIDTAGDGGVLWGLDHYEYRYKESSSGTWTSWTEGSSFELPKITIYDVEAKAVDRYTTPNYSDVTELEVTVDYEYLPILFDNFASGTRDSVFDTGGNARYDSSSWYEGFFNSSSKGIYYNYKSNGTVLQLSQNGKSKTGYAITDDPIRLDGGFSSFLTYTIPYPKVYNSSGTDVTGNWLVADPRGGDSLEYTLSNSSNQEFKLVFYSNDEYNYYYVYSKGVSKGNKTLHPDFFTNEDTGEGSYGPFMIRLDYDYEAKKLVTSIQQYNRSGNTTDAKYSLTTTNLDLGYLINAEDGVDLKLTGTGGYQKISNVYHSQENNIINLYFANRYSPYSVTQFSADDRFDYTEPTTPTIEKEIVDDGISLTLSTTDTESGLDYFEYKTTGSWIQIEGDTFLLADNSTRYYFRAIDIAGNISSNANDYGNFPPTNQDSNITILMNTTYDFGSVDFLSYFSDVNEDDLVYVRIVELPTHGTLKKNGTNVTLNQYITKADLETLTYTPTNNYEGSDSFRWLARDTRENSVDSARVGINIVDEVVVENSISSAAYEIICGSGPLLLDLDVEITSISNLGELKVIVENGFQVGDILSFDETLATSYGLTGDYNGQTGVLNLIGSATAAEYEAVAKTIGFDTSAGGGNRSIIYSISKEVSNVLYNSYAGHFYEFIPSPAISWSAAKAEAELKEYNGYIGYLATVMSEEENNFLSNNFVESGWLGASDEPGLTNGIEGDWYWVTGPETGLKLWEGGIAGDPYEDMYANFPMGREPNNTPSSIGEDYLHFIGREKAASWMASYDVGDWNDGDESVPYVQGYYVEYGTDPLHTDEAYNLSSIGLDVVVLNSPPTIPGPIILPALDTVIVGLDDYTVSWGGSEDCNGDEIVYVVEFYNGDTWTELYSGTNTSAMLTVGSLIGKIDVKFRVKATNVGETTIGWVDGAWGEVSLEIASDYRTTDSYTFKEEDITAPTVPVITLKEEDNDDYISDTWTQENVQFTLSGSTDDQLLDSEIEYLYSIDKGSNWVTTYKDFNDLIIDEAITELQVKARDQKGNTSDIVTKIIKIDRTVPSTPNHIMTDAVGNQYESSAYAKDEVTVTFGESIDNVTEVTYEYSLDNGANWQQSDFVSVTNYGETVIDYRAVDGAGNKSLKKTTAVKIDNLAPTGLLVDLVDSSGGIYDHNTWTNQDVTLFLSGANDLSGGFDNGVIYQYSFNDTGLWLDGNNVTVTSEGITTVHYRAKDKIGNISNTASKIIKIDISNPELALKGLSDMWIVKDSVYTEPGTISSDVVSGLNGSVNISGSVDTATEGEYILTYTATDFTGNEISVNRVVHVHGQIEPTINITDSELVNIPTDRFISSDILFEIGHTSTGTPGLFTYSYRLNNGEWVNTSQGVIDTQGITTIDYRVYSEVLNEYFEKSASIRIDQSAPSIPTLNLTYGGVSYLEGEWVDGDVLFSLADSVDTNGNGVVYEFSLDNGVTFVEGQSGIISENGATNFKYRVKDSLNNTSDIQSAMIKIDTDIPTKPSVTLSHSDGSLYSEGTWTNDTITLVSSGSTDGYTEVTLEYTLDDGNTWIKSSQVVVSDEGINTIGIRAIDDVGHSSVSDNYVIKIDKTNPTIGTINLKYTNDNDYNGEIVKEQIIAYFTGGSDNNLFNHMYSLDGGITWSPSSSVIIGNEGSTTVMYRTMDQAGNISDSIEEVVIIDKTAPTKPVVSGFYTDDSSTYSVGTETNRDVTVIFNESSDLNSISYEYSVDNGNNWQVGYQVEFSGTGTHKVIGRTKDSIGNISEVTDSYMVIIDQTDPVEPTIELKTAAQEAYNSNDWSNENIIVSLIPSQSGEFVSYSIDGAPYIIGASFEVVKEGTTTINVKSIDNVGNESSVSSVTIQIDKVKPSVDIIGDGDIWLDVNNPVAYTDAGVNNTADALSGLDGVPAFTTNVDPNLVGVYQGIWTVKDLANNETILVRNIRVVDPVVPTITMTNVTSSKTYTGYTWTGEDVDFVISHLGSGISDISYSYSTDGGITWINSSIGRISESGTTELTYRVEYNDGSAKLAQENIGISVDKEGPTSPKVKLLTADGEYYEEGVPVSEFVSYLMSESIDSSGSVVYEVSEDGGVTWVATDRGEVTTEGTTTLKFRALDQFGNSSQVQTVIIIIDTTGPINPTLELVNASGVYTSGSISNEDISGSIVLKGDATKGHYSLDNGVTWQEGLSFTLSQEGQNTVNYKSEDILGNFSEVLEVIVSIDTTKPLAKIVIIDNNGELYTSDRVSNTDLQFTIFEEEEGLSYSYSLNNVDWIEANKGTISNDGITTIYYYSEDQANNRSITKSEVVKIDKTKPTKPTVTFSDGLYSAGNWTKENVDFTLSNSIDESDVLYSFSIDGGTSWIESATGTISTEGDYILKHRAIDSAGNVSDIGEISIKVDKTSPNIAPEISLKTSDNESYVSGSWSRYDVSFEIGSSEDSLTDVSYEYSYDGISFASGSNGTVISEGTTTVSYRSVDEVGNRSGIKTVTIKIDKEKPSLSLEGSNPYYTYVTAKATLDSELDKFIVADVISGIASASYSDNSIADTAGTYVVTYNVVDQAGNMNTLSRIIKILDSTSPAIYMSLEDGTDYSGVLWTNQSVSFEIDEVADSGELPTYSYSINNGTIINDHNATISTDGTYIVTYGVTYEDVDPLITYKKTATIRIDKTAPTMPMLDLIDSDGNTYNSNEVSEKDITFTINGSEEGLKYFYSLDDGITWTESNNGQITKSGSTNLNVKVVDKAGNESAKKQITIKISREGESRVFIDMQADGNEYSEGGWVNSNVQFNIIKAPSETRTMTYEYSFDGGTTWVKSSTGIISEEGKTSIMARGKFEDNTYTGISSVIISIDRAAPIINIIGSPVMAIEQFTPYIELGASAFDINSGVNGSVSMNGDVNTEVLGTYTVTYSAIDYAGNNGDTYSRTIHVVPAVSVDTDLDGLFDDIDPDDDNDGILDIHDGFPLDDTKSGIDSDGDGEDDAVDTDDDNDGVLDTEDDYPTDANKATIDGVDTDGDGVEDLLDIEPNNANLSGLDTDGDTIDNAIDPDDDNDGINDNYDQYPTDETRSGLDTDEDGIDDAIDTDDDNDGVLDVDDSYPNNSNRSNGTDSDGDGVDDDIDSAPTDASISGKDSDIDGIDDAIDPDDDNDGIDDINDQYPTDSSRSGVDTDGDGIDDSIDLDDDNDGINDEDDSAPKDDQISSGVDTDNDGVDDTFDISPNDPLVTGVDTDGDGQDDAVDLDDDNDGISDNNDIAPLDNQISGIDYDNDGIDDVIDADDDDDGYLDIEDRYPNDDTLSGVDSDKDGIDDIIDPDDDNDGALDGADNFPLNANKSSGTDTDGDSIDDEFDAFINDASRSGVDTDGDGIDDAVDTDDDGDGVIDTDDNYPLDNTLSGVDTDGDGTDDAVDTDDDNDGILDIADSNPTDPNVSSSGVDSDGDGVNDDIDPAPSDPNVSGIDNDGDGIDDGVDPDDDNDGVLDVIDLFPTDNTQSGVDTDGDGTDDAIDTDDDNDGVIDTLDLYPTDDTKALNTDRDGDGVDDGIDSDPNNALVTGVDTDHDGTDNAVDPDDDNDGIVDERDDFPTDNTQSGVDTDGDGIDNVIDNDDDGDGFDDNSDTSPENNLVANNIDSDGDGIDDVFDSYPLDGDKSGVDTDGDGLDNAIDPDDDNDGIIDLIDLYPIDDSYSGVDTDEDGIDNAIDFDDDNDGVSDFIDDFPLDDTLTGKDTDSDGIDDVVDTDDDNDGIPDYKDQYPTNGNQSGIDTDGDGIDNAVDPDDDNDGTPDEQDQYPTGSGQVTGIDRDGDGVDNLLDSAPDNPLVSGIDNDNDGIDDALDPDDDNDGMNDTVDRYPNDDARTGYDTDGDGIDNAQDSDDDNDNVLDDDDHFPQNGNKTDGVDTDGDGIDDTLDAYPNDANKSGSDTDRDGIDDALDTDDDNDSVDDDMDLYPTDSQVSGVDTDGDSIDNAIDPDDDNDGVLDVNDTNPTDSTQSGVDTDGDGIDNAIDPDDDNDGVLDVYDTAPMDDSFSGLDTDKDGIDDALDSDDDGDGSLDDEDQYPKDGNQVDGVDRDNDGIDDVIDLDPDDGTSSGIDTDNDGIDNALDPDDDNDDVLDFEDQYPTDETRSGVDTDNDGIDNAIDPDDDNDGVADDDDTYPTDASRIADNDSDRDGDGILDNSDRFPDNELLSGEDHDHDNIDDAVDNDDDNDGVEDQFDLYPLDPNRSGVDTDGDGTDNAVDNDDDNDGVNDDQDSFPLNSNKVNGIDSDGDGIDDIVDINPNDNSNSGIDTDGDGINDAIDTDDDNDGVPDSMDQYPMNPSRSGFDTDKDGIDDAIDTDDDNDGISDVQDTYPTNANKVNGADSDGDGIDDILDNAPDNAIISGIDSDNDGIDNAIDLDDDNDSVIDSLDQYPTDETRSGVDTDNDGIDNAIDPDDDNDGVPDELDSDSLDLLESGVDSDGDGIADSVDPDDDNDGVVDTLDIDPTNPNRSGQDSDNDLIDDAIDPDDDNDGVLDGEDYFPNNGNKSSGIDSDGDGIDNSLDQFPNDATKSGLDTDNDGIDNAVDPDDDNDSVLDTIDKYPTDMSKSGQDSDNDGIDNAIDLDDDNDGVLDVNDNYPTDANKANGTDTDNDGVSDDLDSYPNDPLKSGVDTDNDGIDNAIDPDDDNDGVLDTQDSNPTNANISGIDTDSDGIDNAVDLDDDNDGVADVNDSNPTNANISGMDTDSDGIDNAIDLDDDNDGIHDEIDVYPTDDSKSGQDSDNDGIDDAIDLDDDNDGVLDRDDSYPFNSSKVDGTDSDGDGIDDVLDLNPSNGHLSGVDADNDGIDDAIDVDDDNDGVPDGLDIYPTDSSKSGRDSDGDGIDDILDVDDDNDGVLDIHDAYPTNSNKSDLNNIDTDGDGVDDTVDREPNNDQVSGYDTDNDGLDNAIDPDDDNDGVDDVDDVYPTESDRIGLDSDGDGIDNIIDPDDDNDGVLDDDDHFPQNGNKTDGVDSDGDGIDDVLDQTPADGTSSGLDTDEDTIDNAIDPDDDNDGVLDVDDQEPTDRFISGVDTDGDGIDNAVDLDDDNDGILDINDAYPTDDGRTGDNDRDGDGVDDGIDIAPDNANVSGMDTDRDGIDNAVDLDDDNDGVPDLEDEYPWNITLSGRDFDKDGIDDAIDNDDDNDGVNDVDDLYPTDNRVSGNDSDRDGMDDAIDLDDDNDGVNDITDAYPLDANKTDGTDSDGDGVDDVIDSDDGNPLISGIDTDNDQLDNAIDQDDDNDGTEDILDNYPTDSSRTGIDTDGDGLDNAIDLDDDNDGVLDISDDYPLNSSRTGGIDSDNDGIEDALDREPNNPNISGVDADNDHIDDAIDPDDDNDGINDIIDHYPTNSNYSGIDTDNDGIDDAIDLDDDGDGVNDSEDDYPLNANKVNGLDQDQDGVDDLLDSEPTDANTSGMDTDNDGIDNAIDDDDDNDTCNDVDDLYPTDSSKTGIDSDGDGIDNVLDIDDDNDGISDQFDNYPENANKVSGTDSDGDGVDDDVDSNPYNPLISGLDTDNDGTDNAIDSDDDNDGVLDVSDEYPTNSLKSGVDNDNDGLDDAIDSDDDNDGILDKDDDSPLDREKSGLDTDLDGYDNAVDSDDDNDGIIDSEDMYPTNDQRSGNDSDNDGLDDAIDPDDDNDGYEDIIDSYPTDGTKVSGIDSDNDGVDNEIDGAPSNPFISGIDTDGDGIDNVSDLDDDNDGVLDSHDAYPTDGNRSGLDSDSDGIDNAVDNDDDNDGIADIVDNYPTDANKSIGVDTDGDGVDDTIDQSPNDASQSGIDTDGDGIDNVIDLDDDNDGIADNQDLYPTDPGRTGQDSDGDGIDDVLDNDDDNDGIIDELDSHPIDASLTGQDSDGDGLDDALDPDDDNDGLFDELDLYPTDNSKTGWDTDGDGIDDALDTDDDADKVPDSLDQYPKDGNRTNGQDSDGDGVDDTIDQSPNDASQSGIDTDNDGLDNAVDNDDDNDGVNDQEDNYPTDSSKSGIDTDGDGIDNAIDGDDDNDGVLDNLDNYPTDSSKSDTSDADGDGVSNDNDSEPYNNLTSGIDTDGDGIDNAIDTDDDNDGVLDIIDNYPTDNSKAGIDTDNDGMDDAIDLDDDNDGVLDIVDSQPHNGNVTDGIDTDNDGVDDSIDSEPNNPLISGKDSDGDGIDNAIDSDDDNDTVEDILDQYPTDNQKSGQDSDGDGVDNILDPDDDNDGVPDTIDSFPMDGNKTGAADTDGDGIDDSIDSDPSNAQKSGLDSDNDGIDNAIDLDDDNDGINDSEDLYPTDSSQSGLDSDADGINDALDMDDDNDGVEDKFDDYPRDPSQSGDDTDHDGIDDVLDTDDDGDGVEDNLDSYPKNGNKVDNVDTDGDGVDDVLDSEPNDASHSGKDFDNDNIDNAIDPDDDNDLVYDGLDQYPTDELKSGQDTDGDGIDDAIDQDDDNDGILDTQDDYPMDGNKASGVDSDNDGVDNQIDQYPSNGSLSGLDSDNDGTDNALDLDDDNDGIPDVFDDFPTDSEKSGNEDINAPWLVLLGEEAIEVYLGETYYEAGFIAADDFDGYLIDQVVISGFFDTGIIGTYELTYSVEDSSGNKATAKRDVTVKRKPIAEDTIIIVENNEKLIDSSIDKAIESAVFNNLEEIRIVVEEEVTLTNDIGVSISHDKIQEGSDNNINIIVETENTSIKVPLNAAIADAVNTNERLEIVVNKVDTTKQNSTIMVQAVKEIHSEMEIYDNQIYDFKMKVIEEDQLGNVISEEEIENFTSQEDIQLEIGIGAISDEEVYLAFYYNPESQKWEYVRGNYIDNRFVIMTNHLSIYAVMTMTLGEKQQQLTDLINDSSTSPDIIKAILEDDDMNFDKKDIYERFGDEQKNETVNEVIEQKPDGGYLNFDELSNSFDEIVETIYETLLLDSVKPVITINGQLEMILLVGATYEEFGATAKDNLEGDVSSRMIIVGNVNTTVAGAYEITYMVSDTSGNSTTLKRIIEVVSEIEETNNNSKTENSSQPILVIINVDSLLLDNSDKSIVGDSLSIDYRSYTQVEVSLAYDVTKVINEDRIGIYGYDVTLGEWIYIGGTVDKANSVINGIISDYTIISVIERNITFVDVDKHWAQEEIESLAVWGIINGDGAGYYKPNDAITRAEFTAIAVRALGLELGTSETGFEDVEENAWYAKYILAGRQAGIIKGVSEVKFEPNRTVTRQEMTAILMRTYHILNQSNVDTLDVYYVFLDHEDISEWAREDVYEAQKFELIKGKSGNIFDPKNNATRAETATVFYRILVEFKK